MAMSNAPEYTHIPLGRGEWLRSVADEIEIPLVNRYFEINPTNVGDDEHAALISRPGLRRWLQVGNGPIQNVYSQPGSFDEALFVASDNGLYRVDVDETVTFIGDGLADDPRNFISMAATANIESTPEYLFVAGGGTLFLYIQNGYAVGTLNGTPANNDVVKIDTTYYKFTSGSVDTGTPAGTLANPFLVALGIDAEGSFQNLFDALNLSGVSGTAYSTVTTLHETVMGTRVTALALVVFAKDAGLTGNSIPTTETGSNLAWQAATLENGGSPSFTPVQTPDDIGVIGVLYISSFVIVIVAQGHEKNGRFYWIEPGEVIIKPLNFATAERSPDPILSGRVIGDQFYLFGTNSTEIWYPTGEATAPFLRTQGVVFDRGIWQGTDAQIRNVVVIVDVDGTVWTIEQGQPKRISNNAIETMIREAQRTQVDTPNP
jgi:hypothetical protein